MALRLCSLVLLPALAVGAVADQPSYELPPINYSKSVPADPVAALESRLATGGTRLSFDDAQGYLKAFLSELEIPASSQSLVFSKTSFQLRRISPTSPRAIYFNDDVYVGWVQGGDVLEVAAVDPNLGSIFYTLSQKESRERPKFIRQTDNCLQCHDSRGLTLGVPGLIVRSVFAGGDGTPRLNLGTFRTHYRSPYSERWGGWYVTGSHGAMRHMGNVSYPENDPDLPALAEKGANIADLSWRVDLSPYLSGGSDIVALMVLEHQTYVHNLLTRANHESRIAILQSEEINRMSGTPAAGLTEGGRSRMRSNVDPLVEALLFSGEPGLVDPVRGTSSFAADFEKRGPFDRHGRSLRRFDLKKRLFRYPLSYLIYSKAFAALPREAKDYASGRLRDVLLGRDSRKEFAHLAAEDRRDILEILRETLPGLTSNWK